MIAGSLTVSSLLVCSFTALLLCVAAHAGTCRLVKAADLLCCC